MSTVVLSLCVQHSLYTVNSLCSDRYNFVLTSNCPYWQESLQSERSDWLPMPWSLHWDCLYVECTYNKSLLYLETAPSCTEKALCPVTCEPCDVHAGDHWRAQWHWHRFRHLTSTLQGFLLSVTYYQFYISVTNGSLLRVTSTSQLSLMQRYPTCHAQNKPVCETGLGPFTSDDCAKPSGIYLLWLWLWEWMWLCLCIFTMTVVNFDKDLFSMLPHHV